MTSAAEPGKMVAAVVEPADAAKGEKPLDKRELVKALTLDKPKLVEELWQITQKQLDVEVSRHTRIESKATSLLTAAGLSLTVAFTFGSTLLKESAAFAKWHLLTVAAFTASIFLGLIAAVYAIRALYVREQLEDWRLPQS